MKHIKILGITVIGFMTLVNTVFAGTQVRFDMNEVMSRHVPTFSSSSITKNDTNSHSVLQEGASKTSLDLNKINSSLPKAPVSLQAVDQDLKELSDLLTKLKQHVDEIRQATQPIKTLPIQVVKPAEVKDVSTQAQVLVPVVKSESTLDVSSHDMSSGTEGQKQEVQSGHDSASDIQKEPKKQVVIKTLELSKPQAPQLAPLAQR